MAIRTAIYTKMPYCGDYNRHSRSSRGTCRPPALPGSDRTAHRYPWEKLVNSLVAEGRADLYITGSNSHLLSGELATYIAGRYVSIEVWPLSFTEHLAFGEAFSQRDMTRIDDEFARYLRFGGFPGVHVVSFDEPDARSVVTDIFRSTLVRDVLTRHKIRDANMFEHVATFAIDNVGNPFSARRVAGFMKSQRRSISHETVLNYLSALEEAFVIARVPRYDLRGRALLSTDEKHYVGDHGIVHALFGYSDQRLPGVLENIIWMELRRRGYDVTIGKVGATEVDFVATRQNDVRYVQVATTIALSPETRRREYAPLEAINDNHPKYVLTLDPMAGDNTDGIRHLRIPDFLLSAEQ
ncbi:AAA family ATPase [Gordonia pseudamarae]|jgi:predicted AAA+ superfamily ATPase|uniref:AAA family ATPase n=2 Tax=Gordonia pseudamarae TaxID=2831662 RepID=A0ABX6IEE4_9ACTN|nr:MULTISPECIES: ATP-binding protein [Gordonia]MBD0022840.1 ATP-binding protein [Gordonia sp. (in: high G+C Gram-positive bacteria)]QHN24709.1 AAA family ATPase [Gordonia pseudamarae]QHN33640.1 AAA family ATPase [Gordonia pseudamarae]